MYMDAPQIGGAERYFADLCEGLAGREGLDLHVLSPDNELVPFLRRRLNDEVPIQALSATPQFGKRMTTDARLVLRGYRELRATLGRLRPDLLHVANGGYPGSPLANAALFATRSPSVMTVNSGALPRGPGIRQLYRMLDPLVWRAVRQVIVPAKASASAVVANGRCPARLVTVIPYGIPDPAIDTEEVTRVRQGLAPNGELLVGMVVAPSKDPAAVAYKGHDVLLEAAGRLDRPDIRFAIVGHDPGPEFAARAQQLGVTDRISVLAGFRDTTPLMAAFDLLAVPSTESEALPLVILEAMASGTPVVGSRLSGIPEAIDDGRSGYAFEPGDAGELARIVAACVDDRERCGSLGKHAREVFLERFTSEVMVDRTLSVYEAALRGTTERD